MASRPQPPATLAVPPHDHDAEQAILGAAMLAPQAAQDLLRLTAHDFYRDAHQHIFHTIRDLNTRDRPIDVISVADELKRRNLTEQIGGLPYLHTLIAGVPTIANSGYYADIISRHARRRRAIDVSLQLVEHAHQNDNIDNDLATTIRHLELVRDNAQHDQLPPQIILGSAVLEEPDTPPAIWGHGKEVLWAEGEPMYLAGPSSVGKTTLAQRVALATIGLSDPIILGYPVQPQADRLLYIAADRPRQALRSMRRMVTAQDRAQLDERIRIWKGPLAFDVGEEPDGLVRLARQTNASVLILDSLKDVALGLSDKDKGPKIARALQHLVANDINVLVLHHRRKDQAANASKKRRTPSLDDLLGAQDFGSGAGTVLYIDGTPGDDEAVVHHLKPAALPIGPLKIELDQTRGIVTTVHDPEESDPLATLRGFTLGCTINQFAENWKGESSPDAAALQAARRQLKRLASNGLAIKRRGEPIPGTAGRFRPDRWFATTPEDTI